MTKMRFRIRNLVLALAVAAGTASAIAGPALADDDWGHRAWHEREWRDQDRVIYRAAPAPYYYAGPYGYVAAPPAVVPVPLPVPAPAASFNLVIPFNLR